MFGQNAQQPGYGTAYNVMSQTAGQIDPALKAQWNAYFRGVWDELKATGTISGPEVPLMIPRRFSQDEHRMVTSPYVEFTLNGLQWVPATSGDIVITQYGLYFFIKNESASQGAKIWWEPTSAPPSWTPWQVMESAQLTAWDRMQVTGRNVGGNQSTFAYTTPLASLMFALWCWAEYPDHPQAQEVVAGWAA